MKQQPHKLAEPEILERLNRKGIGVKKAKQLFAKLLRLYGIKPYNHMKAKAFRTDNSGMSFESFTFSILGFTYEEHSWYDREGYVNQKSYYKSDLEELPSDTAEMLYMAAAKCPIQWS